MKKPAMIEDDALTCVECGKQFEWPPERAEAFAFLGFGPPRRCVPCRHPPTVARAAAPAPSTGRRPLSPEHRARIAAALRGRRLADTTKAKLREAGLRRVHGEHR